MRRNDLRRTALGLMLLAAACAPGPAVPTLTPKRSAWGACEQFVQTKYGVSLFDAQQYDPAAVEDMGEGKYYIEIFYAKQNRYFACLILHQGENWVGVHVAPMP